MWVWELPIEPQTYWRIMRHHSRLALVQARPHPLAFPDASSIAKTLAHMGDCIPLVIAACSAMVFSGRLFQRVQAFIKLCP